MLAVCQLVKRIKGGSVSYNPGYVSSVISNAMTDELCRMDMIRVPRTTRKPEAIPHRNSFVEPGLCDRNDIEIKDLIETHSNNEFQRNVLTLRLEGYSDREIAEQLKVSRSYIFNTRMEFGSRLNDKRSGSTRMVGELSEVHGQSTF